MLKKKRDPYNSGIVTDFAEETLDYFIKTGEGDDRLVNIKRIRLPKNTVVHIIDLEDMPELNGKYGIIYSYEGKGRCNIPYRSREYQVLILIRIVSLISPPLS
jgi:uncharacterized protein YhfF